MVVYVITHLKGPSKECYTNLDNNSIQIVYTIKRGFLLKRTGMFMHVSKARISQCLCVERVRICLNADKSGEQNALVSRVALCISISELGGETHRVLLQPLLHLCQVSLSVR